MRQIDKQNKTDEEEQACAHHSKVVSPYDEERVRDEKGQDNHAHPAEDLGQPEAVLDSSARVLGCPYSDEHQCHEDVEKTEGKVDALHRDVSIALLAVALDVDVIEGEVGQLLHGPVGEHDP